MHGFLLPIRSREKCLSLQKQGLNDQVSDISFAPNTAQVLVSLPFQNYSFASASVPNCINLALPST